MWHTLQQKQLKLLFSLCALLLLGGVLLATPLTASAHSQNQATNRVQQQQEQAMQIFRGGPGGGSHGSGSHSSGSHSTSSHDETGGESSSNSSSRNNNNSYHTNSFTFTTNNCAANNAKNATYSNTPTYSNCDTLSWSGCFVIFLLIVGFVLVSWVVGKFRKRNSLKSGTVDSIE